MAHMAADYIDEEFVTEDDNDFDVIIIGAGLTGLTCAYNILKKRTGLDVLIIEANNEIGGRILPKDSSDTFHVNSLQKHITELVNTLRIETVRGQNIDAKKRILYTKRGPLQKLPRFYGAEVYNFLQTIEENSLDPKFDSYIKHEDAKQLAEMSVNQLLYKITCIPYARSLCRAFISSTCAMRNIDDISALWFLVMLNGANGILNRLKITMGDSNRYFIQGGIKTVAQTLLNTILVEHGEMRYIESVNAIKFNDDRAYVLTEKEIFKCEFVIVAVPPPMHDRIVVHSPSQYLLLNSQNEYASDENVFFNVTYKTPLWGNSFSGDIMTTWDSSSNLNTAYNATHNDAREFVLAGYLAEVNSTHTQDKGLFDTLNKCFETTKASNYLKYRERNYYSSNVKIESSPMSVMKPTANINSINCIGVPTGRIFFASSEYAVHWPGTIDGAIEAGKVTAYSILTRIRPQALTSYELSSMWPPPKKEQPVPFAIRGIQYLGLILNIAVLLSFLDNSYTKT